MAARERRGASGAPRPKRRGRKPAGPPGSPSESGGSSSDEVSCNGKAQELQVKRLRLDEGLLQRVQKIEKQQRQQQHRVFLVADGGEEQQKHKAQQVHQQHQLHSKLVALRVGMNSVLRLANNFPAASVLRLLQQKEQSETAAAMEALRKEAAGTFVLLRWLHQLVLQQSSLVTAYRAAESEAAAPTAAGGGWQQRRDTHKQNHIKGGETDVWDNVGDLLFTSGLRSACLANADAWHQQTGTQATKGFSVFNQPVSVQLHNTMLEEEQKLLSRSLRSNHLMRMNMSSPDRAAGGQGTNELTPKEACAVVGCTELRQAEREMHHTQYDDTEFYVEMLKASVASGHSEMDSTELAKEKALLKSRRRENAKEVDRRASKGRKIRYKPIPQLENFMAAEPWVPDTDALPGAGDPMVVESLMRNLFQGS